MLELRRERSISFGRNFSRISAARVPRIACIGRSCRSQQAMAGNQSKCETSMDWRVQSAAKHFALVTRQLSFAALPDATISRRSFLRPAMSRPVALSVTSWRNLRRR